MKRFHVSALIVLACSWLAVNPASASDLSLNTFIYKTLPVLVHVNTKGQVTKMSPAIELRPQYRRLLRRSISKMIVKPAMRHGHPVASQFVMNLGVKASPRDDGRYNARFVYVSSQPVPLGTWFWEHEDGHRLALASKYWHDLLRGPRETPRETPEQWRQSVPDYSRSSAPAPVQNTSAAHSQPTTSSPHQH